MTWLVTTLAIAALAPPSGIAGASASSVTLRCPSGLALSGNHLYFSESGGHSVRRIDLDSGEVTLIAGTGSQGLAGDGGPATAANLAGPMGLALTRDGGLIIADQGNDRIRRVDLESGTIRTVVGGGQGEVDGPALEMALAGPYDVAIDPRGDLLIADTNHDRILRVDGESGMTRIFAGTGERDFAGDGGPAKEAHLRRPHVVAVDHLGRVVIGDSFNLRIRRVDPQGRIHTIAGTGEIASSGDGGPAPEASFVFFGAIHVNARGDLYVTEFGANKVRRIDSETGRVSTVVGDGAERLAGDGGPAAQASLASPIGLVVDGAENLYIADCGNHRIRRVDGKSGQIESLVGGEPEK